MPDAAGLHLKVPKCYSSVLFYANAAREDSTFWSLSFNPKRVLSPTPCCSQRATPSWVLPSKSLCSWKSLRSDRPRIKCPTRLLWGGRGPRLKPETLKPWKDEALHTTSQLTVVRDQFWGECSGTRLEGRRTEKEREREREREREGERQWGCVSPQSDRQDVDQQEGGNPLLGCRVTGGSAQGLAGGRGEGQEPWLSKLAVLAFHCGTQRHKAVIHGTDALLVFTALSLPGHNTEERHWATGTWGDKGFTVFHSRKEQQ